MKDSKGHGSDGNGNRAPLKGHAFHMKPNDQLKFISRDAAEAAKAMQGHNPQAEGKYLDQMNDAQTILGYRARGGKDFSAAHQSGVEAARGTPKHTLEGRSAPPVTWTPETARRRVGGTYGT